MASWIFCTVLFAASLAASEGASITEGPVAMTSEVGLDVNITCEVSIRAGEQEALRWTRIVEAGTSEGEAIYTWPLHDQPEKSHKYQIFKYGDHFDLRILDLDFFDGGQYVCQAVLAAQNKGAPLVVLNTPVPITPATTLKSGSTAELTCEATFAAPRQEEIASDHMPVMASYMDTNKLTVKEEVFPGVPGTKWWVMRQTAEVTVTDNDDGKELICSIETKNPYYHLENRKPIFVQHPVSMVSVQNLQDVYYVGDVINCTANGNPSPDFKWEPVSVPQMTGARTYDSDRLELTHNLIGSNTWKCTVSNNVGGKIIKEYEVSFEVEPNPYETNVGESKGGGTNSVAIALGVVIPIIVIGVILLGGFLIYRHKANKEAKDTESVPDLPKELPPNPKPPGHMRMMPPQVYDPKEAERAAPLLDAELRPARPVRPMPQPRNHTPESQSLNSSRDATDV